MRKVRGIVNLFNSPSLGALTDKRCYGSVTFLGRYALIDFIMSNFTNSGIDEIDILVKQFPSSLRRHISDGSTFLINTKLGGLTIISNEIGVEKKEYNNEITSILANKFQPEKINAEYVVIAPAHILYTCDFTPLVEAHINSGKDITLLGKTMNELTSSFKGCQVLKMSKDGSINNIVKNHGQFKRGVISLETAIMSKDVYAKMIKEQPSVSKSYGFNEMFIHYIKNNSRTFNYTEYEGIILPITSLGGYTETSFWLLPYPNRQLFFKPDFPIYTTTHDTPPVLFSETAEVSNSFIANGSLIKGTVTNSILSRNVVIEEGAVVNNSILFTGTEVGKGTKLNYVLTDKGVVIPKHRSIKGKANELCVIALGDKK